MSHVNQHTVPRPELDIIGRLDTLDDIVTLRRQIIAGGTTMRTADRLVAWLISTRTGEPDSTSVNTRARYRKILADLPAPPPRTRRGGGKVMAKNPGPPIILSSSVTSSERRRRRKAAAVLTALPVAA